MPGLVSFVFSTALLAEVTERIRAAQYEALRAVNKELVALYWGIGRLIVERQRGDSWGKQIVERLAADLQMEFPGIKGFSASNLFWRARLFHEAYAPQAKLRTTGARIAWSHNLIIMERCKGPLEREFYLRMTRKFGWSKNVLRPDQMTKSFLGQTNFYCALTPELRAQAKLAVKDIHF